MTGNSCQSAAQDGVTSAPSCQHRDILLAVDFIGHRAADDSGLDRHRPELLAVVRSIGAELPCRITLEHKIPRSGHYAAVPGTHVLNAPHFLLVDWIPCEKKSLLSFHGLFSDRWIRDRYLCQIDRHVVADRGGLEVLIRGEREPFLLRGDIDEPGLRVERHRLPVM